MREKPTPNDITYKMLLRFLKSKGFHFHKKRTGSSHVSFVYDDNSIKEIFGFPKPHGDSDGIEEPYIRDALKLIDKIEQLKGNE